MTTLVGPRVRLRQWRDDDLEAFAALNADRVAMEYFPAPLARAESDAMAARLRAAIDMRGWGFWCLEIEGGCAGFTGLNVPSYDAPFMPAVEIGWRVLPRYWGHGYATEAARLALGYGFDTLELTEIVSFTAVANARSRAVMERLGMLRDTAGDFDHPRVAAGHPLQRHVLYRLNRSSWRASTPSAPAAPPAASP
jgi:RimJ/RimL family protein N-acetyltransferase